MGPSHEPHELNMIRIRRAAPLAIAALSVFTSAIAAQPLVIREGFSADPSKVLSHATLTYSQADLATPAAAAALLQRIEEAADAVCGGAATKVTTDDKADYETCRSDALSAALARLRNPVISGLAADRAATRQTR